MTAVAAIGPAAATTRSGSRALTLAVYLAGAAAIVTSAAILAAFVNVRAAATEWPPPEFDFDEYLSAMLTATMLMGVSFAGWASWAARSGNDRQALAGLGLSAGMGLAFVNLAWYTGTQLGFGPSAHPFGLLLIAGVVVASIATATATLFTAVTLARTLGRAASPDHELITASARYWVLVAAAWLMSPVALYGLTSAK